MTSPVDFISGDRRGSAPGNFTNGKTGAFTNWRVTSRSFVSPRSRRRLPSISLVAIFASGTPVALAMNGTVREARGLTSST